MSDPLCKREERSLTRRGFWAAALSELRPFHPSHGSTSAADRAEMQMAPADIYLRFMVGRADAVTPAASRPGALVHEP